MADLWTVIDREDVDHDPEFPGDVATYVTFWYAVKNRDAKGWDDQEGPFDTEAEARAYAADMNAERAPNDRT